MSIWILRIFICITKQKIVHSKTSTYKKTLHDFKAFEQVNQGHKRCYKSESLLCVTQTPSPAPSPLLKAVKLHARLRLLLLLIHINKLHENISGALYKKRSTWAQTHRACTDVCIFLVVQSQCDLGHIFQLKVKQREDVKKKAMWNVQCIEVCRASFMMNPPVSPVRWLKDKRRELFVKPRVSPVYVHASENVWQIILSLDGKGFFSWVSVFFSLVLSKLVTSSRFGLSDMFAVGLKSNDRKWLAVNDDTHTQRQMHADTRPYD